MRVSYTIVRRAERSEEDGWNDRPRRVEWWNICTR